MIMYLAHFWMTDKEDTQREEALRPGTLREHIWTVEVNKKGTNVLSANNVSSVVCLKSETRTREAERIMGTATISQSWRRCLRSQTLHPDSSSFSHDAAVFRYELLCLDSSHFG